MRRSGPPSESATTPRDDAIEAAGAGFFGSNGARVWWIDQCHRYLVCEHRCMPESCALLGTLRGAPSVHITSSRTRVDVVCLPQAGDGSHPSPVLERSTSRSPALRTQPLPAAQLARGSGRARWESGRGVPVAYFSSPGPLFFLSLVRFLGCGCEKRSERGVLIGQTRNHLLRTTTTICDLSRGINFPNRLVYSRVLFLWAAGTLWKRTESRAVSVSHREGWERDLMRDLARLFPRLR